MKRVVVGRRACDACDICEKFAAHSTLLYGCSDEQTRTNRVAESRIVDAHLASRKRRTLDICRFCCELTESGQIDITQMVESPRPACHLPILVPYLEIPTL